jgi:hypothetical protein
LEGNSQPLEQMRPSIVLINLAVLAVLARLLLKIHGVDRVELSMHAFEALKIEQINA